MALGLGVVAFVSCNQQIEVLPDPRDIPPPKFISTTAEQRQNIAEKLAKDEDFMKMHTMHQNIKKEIENNLSRLTHEQRQELSDVIQKAKHSHLSISEDYMSQILSKQHRKEFQKNYSPISRKVYTKYFRAVGISPQDANLIEKGAYAILNAKPINSYRTEDSCEDDCQAMYAACTDCGDFDQLLRNCQQQPTEQAVQICEEQVYNEFWGNIADCNSAYHACVFDCRWGNPE